MKSFYKKYAKLINMFFALSFIIVNFSLAIEFRNEGLSQQKLIEQKSLHVKVISFINQNLQNDCSVFEDDSLIATLKQKLQTQNLGMDLVKEKIVSINQLLFKRLVFRTFNIENSNEEVTTYGYLVEHQSSKKCFGLL